MGANLRVVIMMKPKSELKKPELVCPAGDWRSLITAVESGADSIYFGVKGINMRDRADNFHPSQLRKIMEYLHQNGKKGYLTVNVVIMNSQLEKLDSLLKDAAEAGVDAVVLWDMAALAQAKKLGLPIHLSTQASVANAASLEFYAGLGVRRVVLARECTLKDIKTIVRHIREKDISCRVEAFVHGAMCVSISGRCFLSTHTFGKSANRGVCRQPCRREFVIKDTKDESEFILGSDYVLSPKDLCTLDFIDRLIEAGIHSFKIEGRMRSVEYNKMVVSAYREAIDAYFDGRFTDTLKEQLKEQVASVYNRGFSTGFYFGKPVDWTSKNYQKSYEKIFLGDVVNFYGRVNVAEIIIRSHQLRKGDRLLFVGKNTPAAFAVADQMQQEHRDVDEVKRGEAVGVKLPFKVRRNDQVFLWKETES
jgi:U32 family peptidase